MKLVERIETLLVWALIAMLLVSVALGTLELGRALVEHLLNPPVLFIDPETLFQSFGLFLIILIGLELLKVLKSHLSHHGIDPRVVIEVAIIALCSKIVTIDVSELPAETLIGLAALLLGLSAGYFAFSRTQRAGEA
jgi:uncharacterized membrane protein (DUF373 family)